jgi:periplasmic protein TonB
MSAEPSAPDLDSLPAPSIDGAAALLLFERPAGPFASIDWRSSLLSLLTHLLFVALLFALAYWMGNPPPAELPAIEVSLAPDPEPPPPPPPPRPRAVPRPQPPPPPPPVPRASEASSLGEGAPQLGARDDTPSAQPAERSQAPRADKPAPQAKPAEKPEEQTAAPEQPSPRAEPTPPTPTPATEPIPAPSPPPVLAAPQARSDSPPAAPPRASPPPSLALRAVPRPAPPRPAEVRPQRRSPESAAPAPSPEAGTKAPGGPIAAIYDAYLAAVNNQIMEHRSLLRPYFGSSQRSEVRIALVIDRAGRLRDHQMVVSSLYGNLDYTINRMVAEAAPFPPPPASIPGDPVVITVVISFPQTLAAWQQAFP